MVTDLCYLELTPVLRQRLHVFVATHELVLPV